MSTTKPVGPIRKAWYQWKSLRLPWRKKFLVGLDLKGNTYWEFRLSASPTERLRRIVHYPRATQYSEVTVPPPWHQWLRYQRDAPPTLADQRADLVRQERTRLLAAEADARWAAKPSLLDMPTPEATPTPIPEARGRGRRGVGKGDESRAVEAEQETERSKQQQQQQQQQSLKPRPRGGEEKPESKREPDNDPWKRASGPSETWQPQAWTPTPARKR
ncbi:hypothetical protein F5B20DRAFT_386330 [Whalleya microplaca]|nr:hypothetical protein F5B20DRAFT_386330 [Whalleya microplaca]